MGCCARRGAVDQGLAAQTQGLGYTGARQGSGYEGSRAQGMKAAGLRARL